MADLGTLARRVKRLADAQMAAADGYGGYGSPYPAWWRAWLAAHPETDRELAGMALHLLRVVSAHDGETMPETESTESLAQTFLARNDELMARAYAETQSAAHSGKEV